MLETSREIVSELNTYSAMHDFSSGSDVRPEFSPENLLLSKFLFMKAIPHLLSDKLQHDGDNAEIQNFLAIETKTVRTPFLLKFFICIHITDKK